MVKSTTANAAVPALIHAHGELSYQALDHHGGRLAGALAAAGVAPGQLLAFFPEGRVEDLLLLHAAPRAGVALFPLDRRMPTTRLHRLLALSGAEWLLDPGDVDLPSPIRRLADDLFESSLAPPADRALAADAPRLLIATSGSSGEPKAVMLSGANLQASAAAVRARLPLDPGDRWLCCLPLFHIGGLSIPLRCAAAGATAVMHRGFSARRVLADLERLAITHLSLVPTQLHRLLESGGDRPPPPPLRTVIIGGAPLEEGLARRARHAGWPIRTSYGMSETASQVATSDPVDEHWPAGRVGHPLDGVAIEIGREGRLSLRGAMVMLGYANPRRVPGDGLRQGRFDTGDRGHRLGDGGLAIDGRIDRAILSGGEKIDPTEVERVLTDHPEIHEATVVALPDPLWGERLVALIGGAISEEAAERWCRDHLEGPWRPKRLLRVPRLPRTPLGKIDRARCHEIAQDDYQKLRNDR